MYIMAGLFIVGFICNACVKAVNAKYHMAGGHHQPDSAADEELAATPSSANA